MFLYKQAFYIVDKLFAATELKNIYWRNSGGVIGEQMRIVVFKKTVYIESVNCVVILNIKWVVNWSYNEHCNKYNT